MNQAQQTAAAEAKAMKSGRGEVSQGPHWNQTPWDKVNRSLPLPLAPRSWQSAAHILVRQVLWPLILFAKAE